MANKIIKFIDETFGSVRGLYINEQPWLYATDVCKALGIKNTPQAVAELDNDERMTISSAYSQKMALTNSKGQSGKSGGARMYNLINEAGRAKTCVSVLSKKAWQQAKNITKF